jgi:hypothetical protein
VNKHRVIWLVSLGVAVIIGLALWPYEKRTYTDLTSTIDSQHLPVTEGSYRNVAWLTDQSIAFLYSESGSAGLWEYQVILYHLISQEWKEVPIAINVDAKCRTSWIKGLQRLPDGTLGFQHTCVLDGADDNIQLFSLNSDTGEMKLLYDYPHQMFPRYYSFAPDMAEFLQARTGGMQNNFIFLIGRDGDITRLFEGHQHVAVPAWSPDGNRITYFVNPIPSPIRKNPRRQLGDECCLGWQ